MPRSVRLPSLFGLTDLSGLPDLSSRRASLVLGLIAAALVTGWIGMKGTDPRAARFMLRDGRGVESIQALCYAMAGLGAAGVALRLRRRGLPGDALLFALLALGLGFVTLEEISWGQRLLGFDTPEWLRGHNRQREMTLHNLKEVQPALRWVMLSICGYGVFARLLTAPLRRTLGFRRDLYTPRPTLLPFFAPGLLFYAVFCFQRTILFEWHLEWLRIGNDGSRTALIFKDQEAAELLLAIAFLVFTARRLQRLATAPPAAP